MASIVDHADDRDSRQQGECVLRDPFPEEDGDKLIARHNSIPCQYAIEEMIPYDDPEESSPFQVQGTIEMQTLKQVYDRYVGRVESTW